MVGGASAAGFRPGLGRGGTIHSFLVNDGCICSEADIDDCITFGGGGFAGAIVWGGVGENEDGAFEIGIILLAVINPSRGGGSVFRREEELRVEDKRTKQ